MYIKVVVPANGLKVNRNDFVALHSIGKYSEGFLNLDMFTIFHSK